MRMFGCCDGVRTCGRIVAVYEIDVRIVGKAVEQERTHVLQAVPTYMRHFNARRRSETFHVLVENMQTVRIALLRLAAHQLHPDANTQHGLLQTAYQPIGLMLPKVLHGGGRFSHSRKYDFIGRADFLRIVGYFRFHAQASQSIIDGKYVSRIIFDDDDFLIQDIYFVR